MTRLEEELIDLVLRLGAALEHAAGELEDLRTTPAQMPDELDARLTERLVLLATLKRIATEGGAKRLAETPDAGAVREFVVAVYREERTRAPQDDYELPGWPILPEVERDIADAFEEVRRQTWLMPELSAAVLRSQYGLPFSV